MNYNSIVHFRTKKEEGDIMTVNEFWNYILSIENEYSLFRKQIMNRFSLSAAETDILMFLSNNPEFDTAAHISKIRKMPKSQVSLAVNSLCKKDLIEGIYSAENKKSIHLKVKNNASEIVSYGKKVQSEFSEMLFSGFSEEEKNEFSRLHLKIAENIKSKRNGEK